MKTLKDEDSGNIRVADITIAQLSRGLYRSTATALKELVSNAYDADATEVRIDTNYPEFDFISCVDNGTGMQLEKFMKFFHEEGIGSCIKRKHEKDTTDIYKRPIIGRLGIGMLAIGQLCHSFEIESHYKDENGEGLAYWAEIILIDDDIPDKEKIISNNDLETKEIDIGKWQYKIIDYDDSKKGFRIFSSDVRKTFRKEMKIGLKDKKFRKLSFSLPELHSEFYDKSDKSIRDCKPYLETIWELAILSPLPYYGNVDKFPIDFDCFDKEEKKIEYFNEAKQFIEERQHKFRDEKFRVIFDGISLRRHIQLPTQKEATYPKLYFINFDGKVFESPLKFSGYVFAQVSKAIRPLELNGVQIRLRGVGIGGYDSTFLKYYKEIETIRSKWVSGEIFVYEGLESALNIDRDSFNEHDEHFKKLQNYLHNKLDTIFDEINAIARTRSEKKQELKLVGFKNYMKNFVAEESKGKFKLLQYDLKKEAPIVTVDENKGEIILNTSAHPLNRKKANRVIKAIMLAYYSAKSITTTEQERDDEFYELVKKILNDIL